MFAVTPFQPTTSSCFHPALTLVFRSVGWGKAMMYFKKTIFASLLKASSVLVFAALANAQDTEKPQWVDCPVEIKALADPATGSAVVFFPDPIATDNCGDDCVTVTLNKNRKPSGSTFNIGTGIVKFTAEDPSGNKNECSFNVVVEPDVEKPSFSFCPTDVEITVPNKSGAATVPVFYADPVATDNFCEGGGSDCVIMTLNPGRKASGEEFAVGGTSIIKFTATDPSGNSNECSFNVVVNDNNRRSLRAN